MNPSSPDNPLASADEPAVVALAQLGDDKAFEELVRRRQGAIRGLMRQLGGDLALADDLAQEAFILAWRKLATLRAPGAFSGWLRRIAVNVFFQNIRRKNLPIQDSKNLDSYPTAPKRDSAAKMDLEKALARLKPEERLCLVLSYSQGMSHREICSSTGLPLGTVKSHISRGGANLRRYLADYKAGA